MTAFLLYIARGGLYLSVFYAFYLLVMRRTTFFRLNRALLLAGSFLCLLLPLVRLRPGLPVEVGQPVITMPGEPEQTAAAAPVQTVPLAELLLGLYLAGVLATIALYTVSMLRIRRIIGKGSVRPSGDSRLVLLDEDISSFSWGHTIVMSRKDLEEAPVILTHEQMHVRCRHSLDLFLYMFIHIPFWWNPLVWITREELRLVHEFEADEGVIDNGIDATQYQLLLVRKAVGDHRFSLASGFRHANLKNRITMMLKQTSSGWMRLSYLALIPLLAALMYACNPSRESAGQSSASEEDAALTKAAEQAVAAEEAVPYQLIEVKPTFRGGDANEFAKWVNGQMKYPAGAKKEGAEGRVMLGFTIDKEGNVKDVQVLRSLHPDLDAEAVRAVSSCTEKWTPGTVDGNPVDVSFVFPVIFKLK